MELGQLEEVVLLLAQSNQVETAEQRFVGGKYLPRLSILIQPDGHTIDEDRIALQGVFHLLTRGGHAGLGHQLGQCLWERRTLNAD